MNVDNFEGRRRGESAKDFLRRYVDWLKAAGATTVNSYNEGRRKGRDPEELQLVAHSVAMFEGSFNRVTGIVGKLEASDAAEIYDELACMLAATRNIANYVFLPLSAKPLYGGINTADAREEKATVDKKRLKVLQEAIKAECEEQEVHMVATTKFGESIRDGVRKRLYGKFNAKLDAKLDKEWPSADTVERAIKGILIEC